MAQIKLNLFRIPLLFFFSILMGCKSDKPHTVSELTTVKTENNLNYEPMELLVGTYTNEGSEGIYKLEFNPQTGSLSNTTLLAACENPGYLHISADRSKVYTSNEVEPGRISIYEFTEERDSLKLLGDYPSEGSGTCFVELSKNEDLVAAANYGSGNIVAYKLDKTGNINSIPMARQHNGKGPHPNQGSAHAHCVKFDASGKYLYAVDLGIDEIVSYEIDEKNEIGNRNTALKTDPGDGPRHLIFHPKKNIAFVINELSSSIISVSVDEATGKLERIDKQSTLPEDFKGENACADIHLGRDGKFLYASNRGHNSIAVFSVAENGMLTLLHTEPVQGDWPRNFTLSPDGNFLLVANRKSNNITVFKIDEDSGLLSYTGTYLKISQPVCLKF